MAKSLCKWKKAEYRSEMKTLRKLVSGARFVCENCGRSARSKKSLCDPVPLD